MVFRAIILYLLNLVKELAGRETFPGEREIMPGVATLSG
jgi:hypothetical protein